MSPSISPHPSPASGATPANPRRVAFPLTEQGSAWSRGALLGLLLVMATGIILGWASREASLTVYGDDPIYLTLARSLASGHYRDEFLVGAPPHAQYPPGMPAYLLLIHAVAGNSLDAALAANLLLLTMVGFLLADAVRRLSTPWIGVAATAVVMFNPRIFELAGQLRSEIPFLAWCSLALWLSLLEGERPRRWYSAFAIAAASAAFLTRSAGIALIPAIGWALLQHRRWRPLMVGGGLAAAVVIGWFAYARWAGQHTVGHTYANDFAFGTPLSEPVSLFSHLVYNARIHFAGLAALQFGIPDIHHQPLDNLVLGLFLTVPAFAGAWALRRRWPAMVMFLILSTGIMLVFPWPVSRLLTVLIPWLVATMLIGWTVIGAAPLRGERIAIGVALVLAGFGLARRLQTAFLEQRCRATAPFVDPRCYQEKDRSYVAAADYIRDQLPDDAVIAASKPSIIYVLTGRKTLPLELFTRTSAATLLGPGSPVTHVLLSRQFPFESGAVAPRLKEHCASLSLLARYPVGTLLLGARRSTADSTSDACGALDDYLREAPDTSNDHPK